MRRGEEIIYQGYLACDDFAGYPDFLVRVESPSDLGAWSYEPWDTKLARHTKPYFLVQLCCYAEMLERAQGVRPQHLRVVLGVTDAEPDGVPHGRFLLLLPRTERGLPRSAARVRFRAVSPKSLR